jgi:four helix bundle protein
VPDVVSAPEKIMDKTVHTVPHRKLDAWRVSKQARKATMELIATLPRGFGKDGAQLRSSSGGVIRLIAEGADRWARGDKRRRFEEANGEVGETVACLDDLADLGALDREKVEAAIDLWGRVGAMLVGLIRRHQ